MTSSTYSRFADVLQRVPGQQDEVGVAALLDGADLPLRLRRRWRGPRREWRRAGPPWATGRWSPPAAAARRTASRGRLDRAVGDVVAAGADAHAAPDRLPSDLHPEPRGRPDVLLLERGDVAQLGVVGRHAVAHGVQRGLEDGAPPRHRVERREHPRVVRRADGGHRRGGDLKVAVAHQGVAIFDGEQLARQPGGVHHAVLTRHHLLHHARGLDPGVAPHRHAGPVGGLGQPPDRSGVELRVQLEPHRPGLARLGDDAPRRRHRGRTGSASSRAAASRSPAAGGRSSRAPCGVPWKPLKKKRRPATSCMACTRGAAWSDADPGEEGRRDRCPCRARW